MKLLKILSLIAAFFILLIVGYYLYQLFITPKLTKLNVPTFPYPDQSVVYKFFVRATTGSFTVTFGDKKMPAPQLTTALEKDLQNIKSAGFDGIKLDYYFGTNTYLVNRIALHAAKYGLYPIGVLHGENSKSQSRPFTSEEMTNWQKFVADEVGSNKNIIYFWEIWNEPGLELFKYGSPEEFAQLLKATYPVIKKANPNAKVIVTLSAEARDKTGFEDKVLALGGGDYFDILSFHPFGANPYLQEELINEAITRETSLVAKYNNRWPLVIGEIGQPVSEVSEEEQARLAKFLYTQAAKNNLPVAWYYWSDERLPKDYEGTGGGANWGLIRHDGTKRPVFNVIKEFLK